jgi:hypothetical protein
LRWEKAELLDCSATSLTALTSVCFCHVLNCIIHNPFCSLLSAQLSTTPLSSLSLVPFSAMSIDLSSAEQFALASSEKRMQHLSQRSDTNNSVEGMTGQLQQLQVRIMEARQAGKNADALLAEEGKISAALRESKWKNSSEAQSQWTTREIE